MPRAVLKNGLIYPVEPLPPEWAEGQELEVQEVQDGTPSGLEQWYQELEGMAAQNDEEDFARLEAALKEAHDLAKEQMRMKMGLP
ncbi:MAG TPA: hypothetical protein VGY66_03535 [Gemmataceae bacterium]|jgi:hypothetical protein|nr:hypothetical protein [Gemmataceae bacterium]